jgi:alpha-tubulin suppressor-like RCC1 family protein
MTAVRSRAARSTGELGLGATVQTSCEPALVSGPPTDTWEIVGTGENFSCGTKNGGQLFCWGQCSSLQCGDGAGGVKDAPFRVGAQASYTQLALGVNHGCALRGAVLECWGGNTTGQLGNGGTTSSSTPVAQANNWRSVSAGDGFSCAVRSAGELYCWGSQSGGRLGNDVTTATNVLAPALIGSATWSSVSSAGPASCGIQQTGALFCWGPREDGLAVFTHPEQLGTSTAWTRIDIGNGAGTAFQADTLFSWGLGRNGANGLDRTFYTTPVAIPLP